MATPDTTTATNKTEGSDYAKSLANSGSSNTTVANSGAGVNDWKTIPSLWSTEDIKRYQKILYDAGAYGKSTPILGIWSSSVDGVAFKQALAYVNPKSADPMVKDWNGIINTMAANPATFKQSFGGGGGSASNDGTYTSKNLTVNNLSDTDAQDYVQKNFMSVMGRMPNAAELKTYTEDLKAQVTKNASATTTTSTYANGRLTSSKSTSSGGVNPNQYMLNKLRTDASNLIKSDRASGLSDAASVTLQELQQTAADYGIMVPDQHLLDMSESVSKGAVQKADALNYIKQTAASAFPAYKDQILTQGLTVKQLAAPKIGSMSKILEIDPNDISLNDPTIRKALSSKDINGQPATVSQYDFENSLRKDPRWQYTQNAHQTISAAGMDFAKIMGLAY